MALPMVLGFLSKRLGGVGASASHLMNLLGDQRSYLSAAPAGLTSALGLGDVSTIRREAASAGMSFGRWAWPVMLLGLIGLLWWGLSRRDTQVAVRNATRVVGANLGALVNKTLPLGTVLRIPSNGVESKLLAFIEDSNRVVDTNTWFTLDRIEFDTGSARLRPSSAEQMRNIADIMKAYPQVDLKVGGYTDNTGDSAANMALSQERAVNTMNAITGYGIDPSRLAAEGYGSQFPVASNATDDGRQRNRRIDIRVTKK
jgi:outer membrane protein OmpA-like peptidoglycan-associated protein